VSFAAIGAGIVIISTIGGVFFVKRDSSQQPKQVKAVLFGLYFWGLVFLQLIVFGIGLLSD
jgi:glucose uptake protein GlcU